MKHIDSILISLFLLALIMLSSCTHYYYAPNEGVILGLSEKNDVKLSGSLGSSNNEGSGANHSIQLGYSPIKHLGLQGSYFKYKSQRTVNSEMKLDQVSILNGAIGAYYFFNLGEESKDELNQSLNFRASGILLDLYLGYSTGMVDNQYNNNSYSHFTFDKKFVQLGIHWPVRLIEIDYVIKIGNLDYKNGTVTGLVDSDYLASINNINRYDTYFFTESTLRVQIGLKQTRLYASRSWIATPNLDKVNFLNVSYHLGIIIELDEFFKKMKNKRKMIKN